MANEFESDEQVTTSTKTEKKVKKPPLFKVLVHNDHYTTREFVVFILTAIFHKLESEAIQIMLHVHNNGIGIAGIFTYEVAETKVQTVEALAREHEFPLRLTLEPEDT